MGILYSFTVLTVLGALLGLGLAIADKKLSVVKDQKLEELESVMPGANCGGCGFPGCNGYANAVFKGEAQPGLCSPGGQALADKMGKIMGVEVASVEKKVAYVFCNSSSSQQVKEFEYKGLSDCNAASILFRGNNLCKEGCLHLGSCTAVCENNAIKRDENGNLYVDRKLCIGCGKCEKVCPNHVIRLIPVSQEYLVACNNHEPGGKVRKECETGCLGCKLCETKFPNGGFKVDNNLASFTLTTTNEDTDSSMNICPRKCIKKVK